MRNQIVALMIAVILASAAAYAAPARWGIAIRNETRECAGFWPGDEYTSYRVPPDWDMYFPDDYGNLGTGFGNCTFRKEVGDTPGAEEACCRELGLRFASPNIGKLSSFPFILFLLIAALFLLALVFFVWLMSRLTTYLMRRMHKEK